ncbi:Glutathione S-transferase 1 [Bulinus truncatus]|nr:Glutathione S-transferase 1 [Bulinus truncatus]
MPAYKLTYFNARGRGELCRLLFVFAGREFEDVRINREEWPAMKGRTPFGQLPLLEFDGKVYGQSVGIYSYLAREFGLQGTTSLETLSIDQVVGLIQDGVVASAKTFHEQDPEKRALLIKDFKDITIPHLLGCCEKLLVANGTGYFVGNRITLADLMTWNYFNGMENRLKVTGLADHFSAVKALFERVEKIEKIKNYIAKRPPADF